MSAYDVTEGANALRLAKIRWGPTGFSCRWCGHDRAYHLAPKRPRTFQCTRCRRQRSVTADTAMHRTKLPLRVWRARGEWCETGQVPTSSGFAAEHGIASSSAWHLNQRFMGALDLWQPKPLDIGGYLVLHRLTCRRPKRSGSVDGSAAAERAREFLVQRPPLLHEVALGVAGKELVLVDGCPSADAVERMEKLPLDLRLKLEHRGLDRWVWSNLSWRLRTVCVRWISAYVRHLLLLWSRIRLGVVVEERWEGPLLAGPRRDLPTLRTAAARA